MYDLHIDRVGHPCQVVGPPLVRRRRLIAVDPFGELTGGDQVRLPAQPHHPGVDLGVTPRKNGGSIRKAHILLGAGAQSVLPIGPAAARLPVGANLLAFDRHHVGHVDTAFAQYGCLRGHRDRLGARTYHCQCRRHHCSFARIPSCSCHIACSWVTSARLSTSGIARHKVPTTGPSVVSMISAAMDSS
ncbi:Uncharacterised protein [Mycobacteroides abscessus subsp. abscessus]|nr:Uncharacterised protein [Mycobacteroides abscessus subsp. abscessus]